jgi:hypothetical protein
LNGGQSNPVFCPLYPPAGESGKWQRKVFGTYTRVYYIGAGNAPQCNLHWAKPSEGISSSVEYFSSPLFTVTPASPPLYVRSNDVFRVGNEDSLGIFCWLGPGQTINGVTAHMTTHTVTGGT